MRQPMRFGYVEVWPILPECPALMVLAQRLPLAIPANWDPGQRVV